MKTTQRGRPTPSAPLFIAVASAVLIIIGSMGPWALVPGYSSVYAGGAENGDVFWVYGTDAAGMIPLVGDGMVSLVLSSIAGGLTVWRMVRPSASGFVLLTVFILLLVSGAIGAVDWANTANIPKADPTAFFPGDVEAGWGLMLTALATWPGVAATAYQLWKDELQ